MYSCVNFYFQSSFIAFSQVNNSSIEYDVEIFKQTRKRSKSSRCSKNCLNGVSLSLQLNTQS